MRYLPNLLSMLFVLSLAALPTMGQDVLFEQPRVSFEGMATQPVAFASTLDVTDIPEDDKTIPNRAYDNFILDGNSILSGISWAGSYNGDFNSDAALRSNIDFEIKIYNNLPGNIPDVSNVLFSQVYDAGRAAIDDGTQVRKTLVPNATTQDGGLLFDYSLDLNSINLNAGSYWLSVRAEMDFPSGDAFLDPAWAWLASGTGDNLTYNYDEELDNEIEPGFRVTGAICEDADLAGCDTAFTLLGETTNGIFGDFDSSGALDVPDIDMLAAAIRDGNMDTMWDVNRDGNVNDDDHAFWITSLKMTLPGDTDLNFDVSFADFLKLSGAFGREGVNSWGDGNFDTDTDVDFADFLKLSGNFGVPIGGSSAAAQSVPEPSAAVLGGLSLLTLGFARRRR